MGVGDRVPLASGRKPPSRAFWAPPMPPPTPSAAVSTTITDALRKLAERWVGAQARERANYQLYLGELCTALDIEGPRPAGSGYEYEFPVKVISRDSEVPRVGDGLYTAPPPQS